MKDYLEQKRAELRESEGGFTLMEMLIVVAIIAILIAIAIPVFTSQLERAREAADLANIRAAYAEAMSDYIENGEGNAMSQPMTQTNATWDYIDWPSYLGDTYTGIKHDKGVTVNIKDDGANIAKVTLGTVA